MKMLLIASAAALSVAGAAQAQNANPNKRVSVNITEVATEIAESISADVEDVADLETVQVPPDLAATVCDAQANAPLTECSASSTTEALNEIVARQLSAEQNP